MGVQRTLHFRRGVCLSHPSPFQQDSQLALNDSLQTRNPLPPNSPKYRSNALINPMLPTVTNLVRSEKWESSSSAQLKAASWFAGRGLGIVNNRLKSACCLCIARTHTHPNPVASAIVGAAVKSQNINEHSDSGEKATV